MNTALQKMATAAGLILFLASLAIGLLRDVPVVTALYRALMIMILGSVAVGLFFQYFASVLSSFIETQRWQAEQAAQAEAAQKKEQEQEQGRARAPAGR